jgi:hypothetical protein
LDARASSSSPENAVAARLGEERRFTTAVRSEVAELDPKELLAVTLARIVEPTSAETSV